ncbi:MAG: hypothetical protein IJ202_12640 [Bacteroidales bacterium]|nr:hypothetical protein [Bacteroidales bacterium]
MASFNESTSSWETDKGTYTALFASSVDDIRCSGTFRLPRSRSWKVNDVMDPSEKLEELHR